MSKQAKIPTTQQLDDLLIKVKRTKPFGLRNWTILHLSYYAGLRAKEIASLRIQDIYTDGDVMDESYLYPSQTKNDGRKIYLSHPKLRSALEEYISSESTKYENEVVKRSLFISNKNLSISAGSMVHIFKRIYRSVGYPYLSSHSGRRYFATMLGRTEGMNAKELQDYGGWKSVAMAYHYVEVNPKKQKDRLEQATW